MGSGLRINWSSLERCSLGKCSWRIRSRSSLGNGLRMSCLRVSSLSSLRKCSLRIRSRRSRLGRCSLGRSSVCAAVRTFGRVVNEWSHGGTVGRLGWSGLEGRGKGWRRGLAGRVLLRGRRRDGIGGWNR